MTMLPSPDPDLQRELAVLRYVDAVDRGDLDTIASILAEAETDADLDAWIVEANAALHADAELGGVGLPPGGALSVLRHSLIRRENREESMDTVGFLRAQVLNSREYFEGTMADVTAEQAAFNADGRALPIAAQYAHVVISIDATLHALVKGGAPLAATSWAGKTGFSSIPQFGPGESWERWAQGPFDLTALRAYAHAVYAATDEYLDDLSAAELARELDLSSIGMGNRTIGWMLSTACVVNSNMHCGEISCLKGLQGLRGYPM